MELRIADPRPYLSETQPCNECAHHVLRAVREVDDVEQAENHCQAETQHGVERAVDEPDQELAIQGLRRDAEKFKHQNLRDARREKKDVTLAPPASRLSSLVLLLKQRTLALRDR